LPPLLPALPSLPLPSLPALPALPARPRRRRLFLIAALVTTPLLGLFIAHGLASLAEGPFVQLELSSEPGGAEVFVRGRSLGRTPLQALIPCAGQGRVLLRLSGHASWEWIGLCTGRHLRLHARLQPELLPAAPAPGR